MPSATPDPGASDELAEAGQDAGEFVEQPRPAAAQPGDPTFLEAVAVEEVRDPQEVLGRAEVAQLRVHRVDGKPVAAR